MKKTEHLSHMDKDPKDLWFPQIVKWDCKWIMKIARCMMNQNSRWKTAKYTRINSNKNKKKTQIIKATTKIRIMKPKITCKRQEQKIKIPNAA